MKAKNILAVDAVVDAFVVLPLLDPPCLPPLPPSKIE